MNLLTQYLATANFAYSILNNGQLIKKDKDNFLAGTFNPLLFIHNHVPRRLITIYKLKGHNLTLVVLKSRETYYLLGPLIVKSVDSKALATPFLLSNGHFKQFSQDQLITIINLCINLLGAYVRPRKIRSRCFHPTDVNLSLKGTAFVSLNDNGAHVNYAFEKQVNDALLDNNPAGIHTALKLLYNSGRIGILSDKGTLRNLIDFGIIVISTNIRIALRNGMNFELAYGLNDYYVRRLEQQTSVHAVIKCIEDNLIDLSQQINHNVTAGQPPIIVRAVRIISSSPQRNLSVNQLASQLNTSPNYFSAFFKKQMGVTFTQFKMLVKINAAIILLESTNMSIAEIASYLNFNDQAYLSNQFKKYTSYSPNQVRNNPILVDNWSLYTYLNSTHH